MRYAVVIEGEPGNYSAYVPDLPGCTSVGDTMEEVLEKIREAIRFHIEGLQEDNLPVPEATSFVDYVETQQGHMNSILQNYYPLFEMYQALRSQLMSIVKDEDLSFRPGGENPTLGALCREIGEVETSYIESFKTFKEDFSYRSDEPGLESSVQKLTTWYEQLDRDLKAAIEALSEEDIQNRKVDRGHDFKVSPQHQLEIYKEALLIFYGKVSVYLKMMGKTLPKQWQAWIT